MLGKHFLKTNMAILWYASCNSPRWKDRKGFEIIFTRSQAVFSHQTLFAFAALENIKIYSDMNSPRSFTPGGTDIEYHRINVPHLTTSIYPQRCIAFISF